LVAECRARWDDMNKNKKNSSKIGDLPYLKFGCDDITAVVAYLEFIDEDIIKWFILFVLQNFKLIEKNIYFI